MGAGRRGNGIPVIDVSAGHYLLIILNIYFMSFKIFIKYSYVKCILFFQ